MPTPASVARQCLTREAEQALDEAVAVARRRGHAQTTSLHMVSSLLSFPSSALREACSRTRNNAYSMRVQFKALDLCLGVSLDRLPSSQKRVEEPPVSNSLMAAIKRSQANQRRQPENFSFYQQQQQLLSSSSSISVVKVEMQNLILSILDDPMVSRVFGEAGFRSCDIKIAILRPVNQLLRYSSSSRYRGPPIFLCNLSPDNELGRRGFSFPFMGFSGVSDSDENCRRIGQVMVNSTINGNSGKNPLLVGVCASDSLSSFLEMVKRRRGTSVLPVELSELGVICIQNEILRFVGGACEEGILKLRLKEIQNMVVKDDGAGVIVNFGDLKLLTNDNVLPDALRTLVTDLASLLQVHQQKVWLIGAAARYETYSKFLSMFPTIEKDWNLQLLPITTLKTRMGEAYPRSSLMESFVPLGGFFSTPDVNNSALRCSFNNMSRCHACNDKCDQEIHAISDGGLVSTSVADSYRSNLPSWLQMSELRPSGGLDTKAKDDKVLLSSEIAGLHRKWDDICQRLNHNQESKSNSYQLDSRVPSVVGFQVLEDKKANTGVDTSNHTNASFTGTLFKHVDSRDEENFATSKAGNINFLEIFDDTSSKEKHRLESPFNASSSSVGDGYTSPSSVTSITLDLNLEYNAGCQSSELKKCIDRNHVDFIQDFSFCSSTNPKVAREIDSNNQVKSSSLKASRNLITFSRIAYYKP